MDAIKIQREAEGAALLQLQELFANPGHLEKLDAVQKKATHKKAAVEAMLRTSVQAQLEGIRTAIGYLQTAADDVKEIEKSTQEIYNLIRDVPKLKKKMLQLSGASATHSQYAAAMNNLMHIYNITDAIEQTNDYILNENLLHAHKNIMDLENARDDLMLEVFKQKGDHRERDLKLLQQYFLNVDKLAQSLGQKIWYICGRCLDAVQGDTGPTQLVSALRIIEREERIDRYYTEQAESAGANESFMPPGRPRAWKDELFRVLEKGVNNRVEGNQPQDRKMNRHWLAVYLEALRKMIIADLKVVKSGLTPCFPPEYKIYDSYIDFYHRAISARLRKIAEVKPEENDPSGRTEPLEKNELVQLLGWVNSYSGPECLGNVRLGINAPALVADQPLLRRSTLTDLCTRFIEMTRNDFSDWLDKALTTEKDDWYKHAPPEEDNNACFYTQLPVILFDMVEDTVVLTKAISTDLVPQVIDVAVDGFLTFSQNYKTATMAYKAKHFENREFFQRFTSTLIAVANNLEICNDSTDKLEKHIRLTMNTDSSAQKLIPIAVEQRELIEKIEQLKKKWQHSLQYVISALLDEVYEDIQKHLENLYTRQWLTGSEDRETICITVLDYYNDYRHLRPRIRVALIEELMYKIVGEYVVAIDSRRLTFNNYEERHLAAEWLRADAKRIDELFKSFFEGDMPMMTSVIPAVAEILDLRDKSLLALETSTFIRKYPDVHVELLASLIQSREDIDRKEARTIAESAVEQARLYPKGDQEMLRLFGLCKGGKRTLPALEETMQNMFNMVVTTTRGAATAK